MILEKLWKNKIPEDPIYEIENVLKDIEPEKYLSILSGDYNQLAEWTPTQLLLLDNPMKHNQTIQYILEKGVDLGVSCKKGVDFYVLYLLCIFYRVEFQKEEYVNLFLDFFRYGQPQESIFYYKNNIYTLFDTLKLLQTKDILSNNSNFFPLSFKKYYQPLCTKLYDLLYISFLCYDCKFFFEKPNYYLDTIEIKNCIIYLEIYPIFKNFLIQKFKLPLFLKTDEIQKRIVLLHHWKNFLEPYFSSKQSEKPIENDDDFKTVSTEKKQYLNPVLVECYMLRDYEFFQHSCQESVFHKNYLPILLHTKKHPYNRVMLSENEIQIWFQEIHNFYTFPINTIIEAFDSYPYFFNKITTTEENFESRKWFERLSRYFNIHHPYNQISNIRYYQRHEISYVIYKLSQDVTGLKHLKKILKKKYKKNETMILLFCKKLEFYCRKYNQYINVIHFLIEEIIQDLKSYSKLKDILHDTDSYSYLIFDEYTNRFGTTNSQFLKRYLENLLQIYKFNHPRQTLVQDRI